MQTFLSVLLGIVLFGIIIFVHELGHFLTARAFGVGILEFALGMGPKLVSKKGKDGVVYSLRLIPIGGFVSMVGEDSEAPEGMEELSLCAKKPWQRFIIVSAGAVMNILMGFILMMGVVVSSPAIYNNKIEAFLVKDQNGVIVDSYKGLMLGDEILKVGSKNIKVRSDLVYEAFFLADSPVDITVRRDGKRVVVENFTFPVLTQQEMVVGNPSFFYPGIVEKTPVNVIKEGMGQSVSMVNMIWKSLVSLITGRFGVEAMSGPVGVVSEIKETATMGFSSVVFLFVMISLNVGVFNLLPIPALDGGRLFFILVEMIRRKPINPKYEGAIHFAGLVILMAFMVFVTFNDIMRIFTK